MAASRSRGMPTRRPTRPSDGFDCGGIPGYGFPPFPFPEPHRQATPGKGGHPRPSIGVPMRYRNLSRPLAALKRMRAERIREGNFSCILCQSKDKLEQHRIKSGGTYHHNNTMIVCKSCHHRLHRLLFLGFTEFYNTLTTGKDYASCVRRLVMKEKSELELKNRADSTE